MKAAELHGSLAAVFWGQGNSFQVTLWKAITNYLMVTMCDLKRHFISAYGIEKEKLYKWQEQAYHLSQEKLVEVGKISWKGECVTMAQKKKHKSWGYNNLQRRLVENQCIFKYSSHFFSCLLRFKLLTFMWSTCFFSIFSDWDVNGWLFSSFQVMRWLKNPDISSQRITEKEWLENEGISVGTLKSWRESLISCQRTHSYPVYRNRTVTF